MYFSAKKIAVFAFLCNAVLTTVTRSPLSYLEYDGTLESRDDSDYVILEARRSEHTCDAACTMLLFDHRNNVYNKAVYKRCLVDCQRIRKPCELRKLDENGKIIRPIDKQKRRKRKMTRKYDESSE